MDIEKVIRADLPVEYRRGLAAAERIIPRGFHIYSESREVYPSMNSLEVRRTLAWKTKPELGEVQVTCCVKEYDDGTSITDVFLVHNLLQAYGFRMAKFDPQEDVYRDEGTQDKIDKFVVDHKYRLEDFVQA